MIKRTGTLLLALSFFLSAAPLWAWGGRGGYYRGGWHGGGWNHGGYYHGGGIGIVVGAPGPWWYPDYPYDPYYPYAYATPVPYITPVSEPPIVVQENVTAPDPAPDTAQRDLKNFNAQLQRARSNITFQYQDGDINKTEMEKALRYYDALDQEAHAESDGNGGYLTRDQERALITAIQHPGVIPHTPAESTRSLPPVSSPGYPSPAEGHLTAVNDLLLELRTLLDQKLKDGAITKAQHDAEATYLSRVEKQAQLDATANGGHLTATQERAITQQLHQAYYAINHDLVVN